MAGDGVIDGEDKMADEERTELTGAWLAAVLLKLVGAIFLVVGLASSRWLVTFADRGDIVYQGRPVSGGVGFLLLVPAVVTISCGLLSIAMKSRRVGALTIIGAILTAAAATVFVFVVAQPEQLVGVAYTVMLVGACMVAVGGGLTPRAFHGEDRASGERLDGKKHGRWLVYNRRGQLVEIQEWDRGELRSSSPYPPPGAS